MNKMSLRSTLTAAVVLVGIALASNAHAQQRLRGTVEAGCAEHPEACAQGSARIESGSARFQEMQQRCAQNSEACEAGKQMAREEVRSGAQNAVQQGEDFCAQNPQTCADMRNKAAATVNTAKETCGSEVDCAKMRQNAREEGRSRIEAQAGRRNPSNSSGE